MRMICVSPDYRVVTDLLEVEDGKYIKDYSLAHAVFPMEEYTLKDEDDNDQTLFRKYSDDRQYYCAVRVDYPETHVMNPTTQCYEYTPEGLAQAMIDHPTIKWDMLGIFAGE